VEEHVVVRGGPEEADFVAAYPELFPKAYRVAYRLLGSREAAEDTAAEALSRAFARWSHVSFLPYRDAWVLRVTTNLALHALARRRPAVPEARSLQIDDAAATRVALAEALKALPKRQRHIIVLRHLAGLPEAEIAVALGISEGTVKTHTKRALATLRRTLHDDAWGSSLV
jgi:RNA polymerase sigma factor (sigma-70 family)